MKIINDGIVFSNDIYFILNGQNALDFSYKKSGLSLPSSNTINYVRKNFFDETSKIFNNKVTIISEKDMQVGMNNSLAKVYKEYPHYLLRQNLFEYR